MFPANTRVLIAEDAMAMRVQVKAQVRSLGFREVFDVDNGEAAFVLLQEQRRKGEPIGLVLCDINMPQLNGINFLKRIRAMPEYQNLPFLMITGEAEVQRVIESAQAGVSSYILKPFSPVTLSQKLEEVWKKHNP